MPSGLDDDSLRLRIEARAPQLEASRVAARRFLEARGSSERGVQYAELAMEELVTNSVRHSREDVSIDVSLSIDGDHIVLAVEDDGAPFDPLQAPAPRKPESLQDAPIGGLGIALVRMVSTAMHYERRADRNRVVLHITRR